MARWKRFRPVLVAGALLAGAALVAAAGVMFSGVYNIAADSPHTPVVYSVLQAARDRAITVRSDAIAVPDGLDSAARIKRGAVQYSQMCTQCHLAPGMQPTELSQGLYPRPPQLASARRLPPQAQFWVIKHGIKMTGMPAWGATHDDAVIWDVVAFLGQLPSLPKAEYDALVGDAPPSHGSAPAPMQEQPHGTHGTP